MKTETARKDQKHPLCYDPRCDIHTTPKTNVALKSMFPRASRSFIDANASDAVQVNVGSLQPHPSNHGKVKIGKRGRMNKTEAEYAMILEAQKRKGEILRYEFEGMTLRWFDMRYTPDFVVFRDVNLYPVGTDWMYFVEVKGAHIHYSQQAMARFKGARGFWPEFTFELHQKTREGWKQLI